ncbi:MAG TPA: dTMP kinase [Candidatus Acidoferrum sp.]|nr:dTMP kinase [Candidatus Acidoferrum sp.]
MKGLFITFEGTEGSGKSTQVALLAQAVSARGRKVLILREPGGTPIGEEIRHTLKHSEANHDMKPETELLLMNASRAQLVRQTIRPALAAGKVILCDRFYDSTTAYQGYGRMLDLKMVESIIGVAVGDTRPDLTLLFLLPHEVSEARRLARQPSLPLSLKRDRFEEADRSFFERVEKGYRAIAAREPRRVRSIAAGGKPEQVAAEVWRAVEPLLQPARQP